MTVPPVERTSRAYRGLQAQHERDAAARQTANRRIVNRLLEVYKFRSVLDVGCSLGYLLEAVQSAVDGVEILGVDGPWTRIDKLRFPSERFAVVDLQEPLDLQRRFDLVVNLEVAEHIDRAHADTLVDTLVRHGDVLLFSAAIPGQGGTGHVNEQHLDYWAAKFRVRGLQPLDLFRPAFWDEGDLFPWFRQNLILFVRDSLMESQPWAGLRRYVPEQRVAVVHPHYYNGKLRQVRDWRGRFEAVTGFLGQPLPQIRALDAGLDRATREGRDYPELADAPGWRLAEEDDDVARALTEYCDRQGLLALAGRLDERSLVRAREVSPKAVLRHADRLEASGDTEKAEATVAEAWARTPDPQLAGRLARMALDRFDFEAVERWRAELQGEGAGSLTAAIDQVRRLRRAQPLAGDDAQVFVVSLRSDRYRRRAISSRLSALGARFAFVDAYRPDTAPAELRALLRVEDATDGSFGNQLTQYTIWRQVAAAPELRWALVLEDDAFLRAPPLDPAALRRADGAEIVFAGDRLGSTPPSKVGRPRLRTLEAALEALSHAQPGLRAPGSDAYFITPQGAAKLVAAAERGGFTRTGTDWWLLSQSVDSEAVERLNSASVLRTVLRQRLRTRPPGETLSGRVLWPSLSNHRSFGVSRRHRAPV